ncbi:uncharacterized protein LOC129927301 [Biomphalaria glabrata]|uniref:Uncharacterized protein LOC129927301 n=1 Tax=Biomphalaria glabrata TaxID=6526 RepID=A0A9W3AWY6_BIOGL|nr:uncharacterized protein LOC129927301 [Biomphalaria glabrata]
MAMFQLSSLWPLLVLFVAAAHLRNNGFQLFNRERFCQQLRALSPLAKDINCAILDENDIRAITEAIAAQGTLIPGQTPNALLDQALVNIITKQIQQFIPNLPTHPINGGFQDLNGEGSEEAGGHGQHWRSPQRNRHRYREVSSDEKKRFSTPTVTRLASAIGQERNRHRFGGVNSEEKKQFTTSTTPTPPTTAAIGKRHLKKQQRNRHRFGGGSSEEKKLLTTTTPTTTTTIPAIGKRHLRKQQRNRHRFGGGSSEEKKLLTTTTPTTTTTTIPAIGKRHLRKQQRNRHRFGGGSSEEKKLLTTTPPPTTTTIPAIGKRHLRKQQRNRHRFGGGSSEEKKLLTTTPPTTTTTIPAIGKRHLRKQQRNRHRFGGGSSEEKKLLTATTSATTAAVGKRQAPTTLSPFNSRRPPKKTSVAGIIKLPLNAESVRLRPTKNRSRYDNSAQTSTQVPTNVSKDSVSGAKAKNRPRTNPRFKPF